ncbi:MAG: U32 family peptidase [Spirochaetaceae bacterium]|jgi:putative protease|nr:U32 family peptidase [Spirochaetaceae bacterium]
MKIPELLSPAGSPEALDAAIGEGADAIYLGLKNFNARLRGANFAYSQFEGALRAVHKAGRKVYVAVNTVFTERETDRMYQLLNYLAQTGPDAVIVQDLGVLKMARTHFPSLKIHASTQMNVSSAAGCALLAAQGVERVVLARELSEKEIKDVREGAAGIELEVFVHGALCVSVSGLCMFSSFLGGKSANRGMCTQACRRLYAADNEQSGCYFSPRDLQLLPEIKTLAALGIDALKIEGRMKSAEYVAAVTAAYRLVLDNLNAPDGAYEAALEQGLKILQSDFARPKTNYRFYGHTPDSWLDTSRMTGVGIFLGQIERIKGAGEERRVCVKMTGLENAPEAGDSVRFHSADDKRRLAHKLTFARYTDGAIWLSAPDGFDLGDAVYLIQKKAARKFYQAIVPRDLAPFKRKPGFETTPPIPPLFPKEKRGGRDARKEGAAVGIPEGIIAAVSCIEDLYIMQSVQPAAVIVPFNTKTAPHLLAGGLPFTSGQIILLLESVVTCESDNFLAGSLPALAAKGCRSFIVNNISQFDILKKYKWTGKPLIISGAYIYTFNRYAAAFAVESGARFIISPLENSRQNIEKTFVKQERRQALVTVYCYPPLFRFRVNVPYTFRNFTDSQNGTFRLSTVSGSPDGTSAVVVPGQPFSILDKIPFLKEAGFRHFIVDFTGMPLKKHIVKEIWKQAQNAPNGGAMRRGANRFNWKNGFYTTE